MNQRLAVATAVCIMVWSTSPGLAHYEDSAPPPQNHKHVEKPKSIDPWKLLEPFIFSPAHAFSSSVHIYTQGNYRFITSDGIPDHPTGTFPNAGNPNSISEQDYKYKVALIPSAMPQPMPIGMSPFGVALNGIPFDPSAAEWWNRDRSSGWQYEAMALGQRLGLDFNNAHVQPNGAYHYHGPPTSLLDKFRRAGKPTMIGYAADGFPIYGPFGYGNASDIRSQLKQLSSSYVLKRGNRPSGPGGQYDGLFIEDYEYSQGAGDLDECNGRVGPTPEYPEGTYYYVVTQNFPYIPRLYKAQPDSSFLRRPPPGGFRGGPGGRMGGPGGMGGPGRRFDQPGDDGPPHRF